jgi:ribosomal protein S12 methylthiotransferase accessory factor
MDMRLDLPIPSVLCIARRRDRAPGTMVLAAGASLDPEQAVRGALCEVSSYVSDFSRRTSEKIDKVKEMSLDYWKVENIHDHALLYGLHEMADQASFLTASPLFRSMEETYYDWPGTWPHSLDLREDIEFCLDRLRAVGLTRVVVIDQTSPEQERFGLRTARVIVPGLIPIDFGYGRDRFHTLARMKTVPRSAGFRSNNMPDAEFNPLPHPFP